MDYLLVFLLGALVGVAELVSRYRDAPVRALRTGPACLYVVLNGGAAIIALILIRGIPIRFGLEQDSDALYASEILGAGFGAMAVLRSSFFNVRSGDQDVGIGPSSLLQIVLGTADRAVDRIRAKARAQTVVRIMKGVQFNKSKVALPTYCMALMQNLSVEEQKAVGDEIRGLETANMDDQIKVLVMGLTLLNSLGAAVLAEAVDSLGDKVK